MRDSELSKIFKNRIWQWDAKPAEIPTGDFDLNKTIKELQSQTIHIEGILLFEQDSGVSPARIIDSTATVIGTTNTQPQEPLTLEAMIEAASSLPPMPDMRPLRCNQWTFDRLRSVMDSAPGNEEASNILGFTVPFGALEVHLDEELSDGIIMQGDKVLCNMKEQGDSEP